MGRTWVPPIGKVRSAFRKEKYEKKNLNKQQWIISRVRTPAARVVNAAVAAAATTTTVTVAMTTRIYLRVE